MTVRQAKTKTHGAKRQTTGAAPNAAALQRLLEGPVHQPVADPFAAEDAATRARIRDGVAAMRYGHFGHGAL